MDKRLEEVMKEHGACLEDECDVAPVLRILRQQREALEVISTGKYHSEDKTCMTMMACCDRAEEVARKTLSLTTKTEEKS